jgi:hypothetical protein
MGMLRIKLAMGFFFQVKVCSNSRYGEWTWGRRKHGALLFVWFLTNFKPIKFRNGNVALLQVQGTHPPAAQLGQPMYETSESDEAQGVPQIRAYLHPSAFVTPPATPFQHLLSSLALSVPRLAT